MGEVDDILEKYDLNRYGINRDTIKRYLLTIPGWNQADTADLVGVSRKTINQKFKQAYREMTEYERATLHSMLGEERRRELTGND